MTRRTSIADGSLAIQMGNPVRILTDWAVHSLQPFKATNQTQSLAPSQFERSTRSATTVTQGNEPDPIFGSKSIREIYEKCNDSDGKYTVPILFDKKRNAIVSNESSEIIRMLNSEFNEFAKHPEVNLYPGDLVGPIKAINDEVYVNLNNGKQHDTGGSGFAIQSRAHSRCSCVFRSIPMWLCNNAAGIRQGD